MNELARFFEENTENLIHKWAHYFDVYENHFRRFRGKHIVLLEFGVSHGGSLHLWKKYFGPAAKIIGVDINPECQVFADDQVEMFIGDQSDRNFLERLKNSIPKIDILIDDGGHTMTQQIATFEELFEHVDENGVYLCEDLHTSYWPEYGGGYMRDGTFIEYSKNFIDYVNSWHFDIGHSNGERIKSSARSLTYYDSMLVIEKGTVSKPEHRKTGHKVLKISVTHINSEQENNTETHKYDWKSVDETAIKRHDYNHLWAVIDAKIKQSKRKDDYIADLEKINKNLQAAYQAKSNQCRVKEEYIAGLEEFQKQLKATNEAAVDQLEAGKKQLCWKITNSLRKIIKR